jgi:hypothetical protein
LRLAAYPVPALAMACRALAAEFEAWKNNHSPADLDELHLALSELWHKLSPPPEIELEDFFATFPQGSQA